MLGLVLAPSQFAYEMSLPLARGAPKVDRHQGSVLSGWCYIAEAVRVALTVATDCVAPLDTVASFVVKGCYALRSYTRVHRRRRRAERRSVAAGLAK